MARPYYRMAGYVRPGRTGRRSGYAGSMDGGQISGAATGAILVPVALIGLGWMLWNRSPGPGMGGVFGDPRGFMMPGMGGIQPGGALPGMGGFGSKFKKAVSNVSHAITKPIEKIVPAKIAKPMMAVATGGASEAMRHTAKVVSNPGNALKKLDPVTNLAKSPVFSKSKLIRKLNRSGQQDTTPAEPGQQIVYQDAYGNTVTKYQYDMLVMAISTGQPFQFADGSWAMPTGLIISDATYKAQNPQAIVPPTSQQQSAWYPPSAGTTGGATGGGYSSSTYQDATTAFPAQSASAEAPAAVQQFAPAPSAAPSAAPADKKFNPLLAVGAFLAVPVVMGLTGHK